MKTMKKAQSLLDFILIFGILLGITVGFVRIWVWFNANLAKRNVDYQNTRLSAGTGNDAYLSSFDSIYKDGTLALDENWVFRGVTSGKVGVPLPSSNATVTPQVGGGGDGLSEGLSQACLVAKEAAQYLWDKAKPFKEKAEELEARAAASEARAVETDAQAVEADAQAAALEAAPGYYPWCYGEDNDYCDPATELRAQAQSLRAQAQSLRAQAEGYLAGWYESTGYEETAEYMKGAREYRELERPWKEKAEAIEAPVCVAATPAS